MAQRRMFSQKIVGSDSFLDMPVSARELYFQLGMYADDDGFINPKKVVRMVGASDDDIRLLVAKRFVIPFDNGVVVIKHWKINNLIRKDFYEPTVYLEQKNLLKTKENKAYTENVNNLLPQYSIGKDSIDKEKRENFVPSSSLLKESEPTPQPPALAAAFLEHYMAKFAEYVSKKKKPVYPKTQILPKIEEALAEYGEDRLKELLEIYMQSKSKFYEDNLWSLTCFLSYKILNKLHVGNK